MSQEVNEIFGKFRNPKILELELLMNDMDKEITSIIGNFCDDPIAELNETQWRMLDRILELYGLEVEYAYEQSRLMFTDND